MNFFQQKLSGLQKRIQCLSYGIFYLRDKDFVIPPKLRIHGRKIPVHFINTADGGFIYEFTEICLHDCYNLSLLKKQLRKVNTIVDVGANQGLFTIAARQHFANASISCYEPNKALDKVLNGNASEINASVYYEAVTRQDCTMQLNFGKSDLHTIVQPAETGNIKGTAFRTVIERAGGNIDILKMDCEGGEWDILEDTAAWNHVCSVTMEYHLWAKPGSSPTLIKQMLSQRGFNIVSDQPLSPTFGLLTAIRKK